MDVGVGEGQGIVGGQAGGGRGSGGQPHLTTGAVGAAVVVAAAAAAAVGAPAGKLAVEKRFCCGGGRRFRGAHLTGSDGSSVVKHSQSQEHFQDGQFALWNFPFPEVEKMKLSHTHKKREFLSLNVKCKLLPVLPTMFG